MLSCVRNPQSANYERAPTDRTRRRSATGVDVPMPRSGLVVFALVLLPGALRIDAARVHAALALPLAAPLRFVLRLVAGLVFRLVRLSPSGLVFRIVCHGVKLAM